jgi:glycosyltransferase involved in cell wall biosynthesis
MTREFPGSICFATGKSQSAGLARGFDYLRRFYSSSPYAISRFASPIVRRHLGRLFVERQFDVAVCDFLDAAVNFPETISVPRILFQHNVETEIWRRKADNETNPAKRFLYKTEFARMRDYECKMLTRFDRVIAVSEHDRTLMSRWVDPSRITVVPTGVDLDTYHPEKATIPSQPLVLFVGAMDWEPNIDAVQYFRTAIWPSVAARVRQAGFRVVGRNPDRRVQKLASASVEITGSVPSVVEHLREAAVVVVPLRIGGGTRLKIYEAMAMGKAVVSTTVGAEGLDVRPGADIVLADNPADFAQAIVEMLEDSALRRRYESAAARTASQYGWPVIGDRFAAVLANVVESRIFLPPQPVVAAKS